MVSSSCVCWWASQKSLSPVYLFLFKIELHTRIGEFDDVAVLEFLAASTDAHAIQARRFVVVTGKENIATVAGTGNDAGRRAAAQTSWRASSPSA